jgi:hypothetical protein
MPRTIGFQVYKFEELSLEAQENARDWWRNAESQDPFWRREHFESMSEAVKNFKSRGACDSLIEDSKHCIFTGYCADFLLADHIEQQGVERVSVNSIRDFYYEAWNKELEDRLCDHDYIAEQIISNKYEFTASGKFFRG